MHSNTPQKSSNGSISKVLVGWWTILLLLFFFMLLVFTELLPLLLFESSSWQVTLGFLTFLAGSLFVMSPLWLLVYFYFNRSIYTQKKNSSLLFWNVSPKKESVIFSVVAGVMLLSGGYFLKKTFTDLLSIPSQFTGSCVVEKDVTIKGTATYYLQPLLSGQPEPNRTEMIWQGLHIPRSIFLMLDNNADVESTIFPCKENVNISYFSALRVLWALKY